MTAQTKKHLPRLEPKAYRGQAYVHWTMTIEDRRSGWLVPIFNYKFRELLTHAERQEAGFENAVEYIARNPERKGLVPVDGFRDYKYTGCLIPGYPELELWQDDFWPRFWRTYSFLRRNGLFRSSDEELA